MRKRRIIYLACVLLILWAFAIFVYSTRRVSEPIYDGRPASYWITQLSRPPVLLPVSELTKELPPLKLNSELSLSGRPNAGAFDPGNPFEIRRDEPEHPSVTAFRAMGSDAVPALLKALNSDDAEVSANSARLLGMFGPANDEVVSMLVKRMLTTESESHRIYRVFWGALPNSVSRYLQKPVVPRGFVPFPPRDPWYERAYPSSEALGHIVSRTYRLRVNQPETMAIFLRIVPRLSKSLRKRDDWAVLLACGALQQMGAGSKASLPSLRREFQNPARNVELRVAISRAICKIDAGSPETVECMKSVLLGTTNRLLKCAAIVALGKMGGTQKSVEAFLDGLWHGEDPLLSRLAYEELLKINPEKMKNTLPPELKDPSESRSSGLVLGYTYSDLNDDFSLFQRFRPR